MIGIIFRFGNEIVEVRLKDDNLFFRTSNSGTAFYAFKDLQLSKEGVIKEFPFLKDDIEWKAKAVELFRNKLASFVTERERVDYVVKDLQKYGYVPLYMQREGHRIEKFK